VSAVAQPTAVRDGDTIRSLELAVLGAALVFCYVDVFRVLVGQWWTNDVYSHGFLIPAIAAFFVWHRRDALARSERLPQPLKGGIVMTGGLLMLALGRAVDVVGLQELSLIPVLAGLVLWYCGPAALRLLAFPIGYLLFMMPVWDLALDRLHYPFQRLSASLGARLIELAGVPVRLDNIYLELPNITLEVAKVCSGISYLVAVAAIGIPLGVYTFPDLRRRVLLLVGAIGIAVLGNGLRVSLIGYLAYHDVSQALHGPGHVFQGLFVAMLGYVALFGGVALLRRVPAGRTARAAAPPPSSTVSPSAPPFRRSLALVPAFALALAGLARAAPAVDSAPVGELPVARPAVGSWVSIEPPRAVGPAGRTVVEPNDVWVNYTRAGLGSVQLYVGWFRSQATSRRASYWTDAFEPEARRRVIVAGTRQLEVNWLQEASGESAVEIAYWFDLGSSTTSVSRVAAKVNALRSAVQAGVETPRVWVVTAEVHRNAPDEARRAIDEFISALLASDTGPATR
jgi:exosortase